MQRQALEKQSTELEQLAKSQERSAEIQQRASKVEVTTGFLQKFTFPTPGSWTKYADSKERLEQIMHSNDGAGSAPLNQAGGWYIQAAALIRGEYIDEDFLFESTRPHTADFVELLRLYKERKDIERAEWLPVRELLYDYIYERFIAYTGDSAVPQEAATTD